MAFYCMIIMYLLISFNIFIAFLKRNITFKQTNVLAAVILRSSLKKLRNKFISTPASSTTKTGCHDIVEILLKVMLKHQK